MSPSTPSGPVTWFFSHRRFKMRLYFMRDLPNDLKQVLREWVLRDILAQRPT